MGAWATVATTAEDVTQAIARSRSVDRVTVIVVPVDPEKRMPAMGNWWDVPVAEVSADEATRKAREAYDCAVTRQRSVFS